MYYSDEFIEELRSRSNIVDVISGYIKLSRKGSSYKALCPFHNEKTPSFSVNPSRQSYHCFGCGESGDVYSFVMEYERKSFQEAVETLAARAGMELPKGSGEENDSGVRSLKKRLLEIHKSAAIYYYKELYTPGGKQALSYLKGRGLSDANIQAFGLGFSGRGSNALYKMLKGQHYTDAELKASGLFTVNESKNEIREKFWNRIMFPIMDVNRKVIGFGGRVMGDAKPKYMNSPETALYDKSANLYGLYAAKMARKNHLLLCEGYMDVISLHVHGFTNAVATLGTALTSKQASLLHRYTGEVMLLYDSDEAGIKAALRAIPILRGAGISPKVVSLAPYKDPDELLNAEGEAFLEERINRAENGFLFEMRQIFSEYNVNDPEGASAFQHAAAKKLAGLEDEIERENYLKTVAGVYHIDEKILRRQIGRLSMAGYTAETQKEAPAPRQTAGSGKKEKHGAEEALISWIYANPELADTVKQYLTARDFSEGVLRRLAESLLDEERDESKPAVSVLNGFEEASERAQAAAVLESSRLPENDDEQKKAVLEAIALIKSRNIESAVAGASPEDMAAFQNIMEQKKQLELIRKQLSGGK